MAEASILSKADIDSLPTPLAIAIADYASDEHLQQLIKLWHACDAVELLLRLLVVTCIGELYSTNRWTADIVESVRDRIDRPTLGLWKNILIDLTSAITYDGTVLAELRGLTGAISDFFDGANAVVRTDAGPDMLASFSVLRNRLAHGGGLTDGAAATLLTAWEERINEFLQRFFWLRELSFYARSPDGTPIVLRGSVPRGRPDPITLARSPHDDEVVVARDDLCISVWPLVRYGIPWIPTQNLLPEDTVVEVYARRSSVEGFYYTPIGLDVAYWSSSRENATAKFLELFPPASTRGSTFGGTDALESFRKEIIKDAKMFVGRQRELSRVLELVHAAPPRPLPTLWLSGDAGIGKSILFAKVAHCLIAEAHESSQVKRLIVPYRFRRGDVRCSREYFFMLTSRSIAPTNKIADPSDYKVEALRGALKRLRSDVKCIFVLDGADEIDELDPAFLSDVCVRLASEFAACPNIMWVLAGRERSSNSSLKQRLEEAGAYVIFENGLEPMQNKDIRAILLDQTGPARKALLLNDTTKRTELFRVPASEEVMVQLDEGRVPSQVSDGFACRDLKLDSAARCYPIGKRNKEGKGATGGKVAKSAKGTTSITWLLEDEVGKIYYIERHEDGLSVCADEVQSRFVDVVAKKSAGLPLYVRYVVLDILAGRLIKLDGREPLPDGLAAYYRQLLKRYDIGTLQTLLTPVLCLIAVAKQPLTKEQLLVRIQASLPTSEDPDNWFEKVIPHLSSMLRGGRSGKPGDGYSLYHHSLRQHLGDDPATRISVNLELEWLVKVARTCVPLENAGPFAEYMAHHGVAHLLEVNNVAEAVKLLDHLKSRPDREKYFPRGYLSSVTSRRVGLALDSWLEQWQSGKLSEHEYQEREAAVRAMSPHALANIVFDTYETGVYSAVLRVLIEFNYDVWWRANKDGIRDRFCTPYDIVAKHTVGEALSDVFQAASRETRKALLAEVKAMAFSSNIEEREAGGYALQEIFENNPELIDGDVISRWACSNTNIERMILGELLVYFAHAGKANIEQQIKSAQFWEPIWENNAIDIDDFKVLTHKIPADHGVDARLAQCASEHAATSALLERLLGDPYVCAGAEQDRPLFELLKAYGRLAAGDPLVRQAVPALRNALNGEPETRRVAKEIIEVLFSHSLWAVAEAATSVVADLAQDDVAQLGLIDALLDEPNAYWRVRYGTVDAAFNVRELDDCKRFRAALCNNFAHPNSRVRGICCDDFFAWVRLAEKAQRDGILHEFEPQLRYAIEHGSDCWELEYIYLLFSFLHREGFDVKQWLGPNQRYARYLADIEGKPFYQLDREEFLLQIDCIRRAEVSRCDKEQSHDKCAQAGHGWPSHE